MKSEHLYDLLREAVYNGNIGIVELFDFYKVATKEEEDKMEKILKTNNIKAFKKLIKKTLGVDLM